MIDLTDFEHAAGEADLAEVAAMLVACGRRRDAIAIVTGALEEDWDAPTAHLLARLRIEGGDRSEVFEAMKQLRMCVMSNPCDLDALQLLREGLRALGCAGNRSEIERDLRSIEARAMWLARGVGARAKAGD